MTLLKWLIAVAAVFGGFVALMYVAQRALMYHPEVLRTPPAAAGLFDVQEVVLDTADGEKVIVWYAPPQRDLPLVLYFHGNAGALRSRADRFRALTGDGYGLVALSYRGYGGSTGSPSEAGMIADAPIRLPPRACRRNGLWCSANRSAPASLSRLLRPSGSAASYCRRRLPRRSTSAREPIGFCRCSS